MIKFWFGVMMNRPTPSSAMACSPASMRPRIRPFSTNRVKCAVPSASCAQPSRSPVEVKEHVRAGCELHRQTFVHQGNEPLESPSSSIVYFRRACLRLERSP